MVLEFDFSTFTQINRHHLVEILPTIVSRIKFETAFFSESNQKYFNDGVFDNDPNNQTTHPTNESITETIIVQTINTETIEEKTDRIIDETTVRLNNLISYMYFFKKHLIFDK